MTKPPPRAPGPSLLSAAFARAGSQDQAALVTYVMGGDPNLKASKQMALACCRGGADILEVGVPFSDPIADGPTIQRAAERALKAGTTLERCIELAGEVRSQAKVPVVLMGYANPLLAMGEAKFFERCAEASVDAVIVPDLPPEEATELCSLASAKGVRTVFLLAPTSTEARQQAACAASTGFVYFVSVTGVTGARRELSADLPQQLKHVRAKSPVPVVVGFGVSTPEQARELGRLADGVVVGSAIVSQVASSGSPAARAARVEKLVRSLKRGLSRPEKP